jgi:hypothetical protein
MKIEDKKFKSNLISLTENKDKKLIKNSSQLISLHDVSMQYRILSINDFNIVNNIGYFNKKTDFRIGEKDSIIFLDNNLEFKHIQTSEIDNTEYIVYPIPYTYLVQNNYLVYDNYQMNEVKINLSFEFGNFLINIIQELAKEENLKKKIIINNNIEYNLLLQKYFEKLKVSDEIKSLKPEIINLFFDRNKFGYSLNKNIIINSNPEFCLGLLNGIWSNVFYNLNIYSITSILNYLGAMYSITRGDKDTRRLNYYLPEKLKNNKITNKFIKFKNDETHKEYIISKMDEDKKQTIFKTDLWKQFNSGKVLLIKTSDLVFELLTSEEKRKDMYDLTMNRADATNYTIPFGPLLKNSDGDILGVIGVFGKESLKEAQDFSPETKGYYKSFNDGSVQNWVTKDAVLGLYNATKKFLNK